MAWASAFASFSISAPVPSVGHRADSEGQKGAQESVKRRRADDTGVKLAQAILVGRQAIQIGIGEASVIQNVGREIENGRHGAGQRVFGQMLPFEHSVLEAVLHKLGRGNPHGRPARRPAVKHPLQQIGKNLIQNRRFADGFAVCTEASLMLGRIV